MMPVMNGIEVRAVSWATPSPRHPGDPGYREERGRGHRCRTDAGAHDYVTKPFKKEILAARVRSAVHIKQNHDRPSANQSAASTEIVERQRVQHELARAKKLESIGHLAAGVAHDQHAFPMWETTSDSSEAFADFNTLLINWRDCSKPPGRARLRRTARRGRGRRRQGGHWLPTEEVPKAIDNR